jgi:O-antigen/teichoic acid export membrane protein
MLGNLNPVRALQESKLARNTGWMFFGQGLRFIIQAFYFAVIARGLGVAGYGVFVGVVALVGILSPFATLGSGFLIIKNVARNPEQFAQYWGRALLTTIGSGSTLFLVGVLLARFLLPATIPIELVVCVAASDLFAGSLTLVCWQAFQAFEQLNWTATLNVILSTSRLLGAVILVVFERHPSATQWGRLYFASTATAAVIALALVFTKLGRPTFRLDRKIGSLREGFCFSASLSAQTIYNDIDKTMLARLGTLDATGIYGAAYRLIDVSFTPVGSLLAAAYPNFFRTGREGLGASMRYATRLMKRALAYASLVCIVLLLAAGAVPYILGGEYKLTEDALRWLAVLPVLKVIHFFLSDALTSAGYIGVRSAIQVGVAVFNVLINLWIIPAYSWRGAAWSSIASDALLACAIGTAVFVLSRSKRLVGGRGPVEVRVQA